VGERRGVPRRRRLDAAWASGRWRDVELQGGRVPVQRWTRTSEHPSPLRKCIEEGGCPFLHSLSPPVHFASLDCMSCWKLFLLCTCLLECIFAFGLCCWSQSNTATMCHCLNTNPNIAIAHIAPWHRRLRRCHLDKRTKAQVHRYIPSGAPVMADSVHSGRGTGRWAHPFLIDRTT
jgi:hypothetical protein